MKTPIEMMLDGVAWQQAERQPDNPDGLPWATHEGVLEIAGNKLRCYRLSDGRAIFNAEDIHAFFGEILSANALAKPTDSPQGWPVGLSAMLGDNCLAHCIPTEHDASTGDILLLNYTETVPQEKGLGDQTGFCEERNTWEGFLNLTVQNRRDAPTLGTRCGVKKLDVAAKLVRDEPDNRISLNC